MPLKHECPWAHPYLPLLLLLDRHTYDFHTNTTGFPIRVVQNSTQMTLIALCANAVIMIYAVVQQPCLARRINPFLTAGYGSVLYTAVIGLLFLQFGGTDAAFFGAWIVLLLGYLALYVSTRKYANTHYPVVQEEEYGDKRVVEVKGICKALGLRVGDEDDEHKL